MAMMRRTLRSVFSDPFEAFYGVTHLCCIVFTIVAAAEYQQVSFNDTQDHHMFKLVDIMYVAALANVGLGIHLILRGYYNTPFYRRTGVQAFLVFKSFVSTFLICGTWCGLAVIDSFVSFSGISTAWDATNESIEPHMRVAFATHTAAVTFAFISFSSTLAILFASTAGATDVEPKDYVRL